MLLVEWAAWKYQDLDKPEVYQIKKLDIRDSVKKS